MRKIFVLTVLFVLGSVVMAGCTGEGISGSVSGGSSSSSVNPEGGKAEGRYNTLKGTYPASYEISIVNDDVVHVEVAASVEVGRLRVYLKGPEGEITEVSIEPGASGTLSGPAEVTMDETFRVYFEAVDGEAKGVTYAISFQY